MDLVVYIVVDDVTGLWENLAGMVTYISTLLAELCDPVWAQHEDVIVKIKNTIFVKY